ncbi:hypothetical protein ILYODFUR_019042, partial [Ilyodon furcidens]
DCIPGSLQQVFPHPRLPQQSFPGSLQLRPCRLRSLQARCSEATPAELEQCLRFYARQIKNFRKTSLMYSSPELVERIRQMERDYETAVREFYCRPPSPTPSQMSSAAAQSMSCLQNGGTATAEQPTSGPPPDTPQPDTPQPDSGPDPKSASTSSTCRRGMS